MPATAIDLGTYSIKAIVGKTGNEPVIDKTIDVPNPTGLAFPKDEIQAEQLLKVVDQLIHDHKLPTSEIMLSLPEEIVSTKVIHLPPLSDAELASAIDWQAEQHIAIPLEQLSLEYRVLYRPSKKEKNQPMKVLLVGTRKDIVELYSEIFFSLGIQPKTMETQIFSIVRAMGFEKNDPTTLVAHLGASNTQIAVISQNEIKLATNKKGGGSLLIKTVQHAVNNITPNQAVEYLHSAGLLDDQFQGKIKEIITPALDPLAQEIVKTINFYNNEQPKDPVLRLVLTGGLAQLPGIVAFFAQLTGLEVLLAAPFATAKGNIPENGQQAFVVCTGLMMRNNK